MRTFTLEVCRKKTGHSARLEETMFYFVELILLSFYFVELSGKGYLLCSECDFVRKRAHDARHAYMQ